MFWHGLLAVFITSSILSSLLRAFQLHVTHGVGGTTEDALHELLRPVVIEELRSHGILLNTFFLGPPQQVYRVSV